MRKTALQIALIVLLTSAICSCTRKVYIPVQSVKIEYRDRVQKDSIYLLDSVRIVTANDTVYFTKYKTEVRYRVVRDSIQVKDTIQVAYEVEKIVYKEKALSWYQSLSVKLFTFLLSAIAGYFIFTYRKKILVLFRFIFGKIF